MGKGDKKTKKGKIFKGSYGNSRRRDRRKRNLINPNNLRRWSKERIYIEIGRYDFTVSIVFKKDSFSYNKYGKIITGQIYYSKKERQFFKTKINSGIKKETDGNVLVTTYLKEDLTKEQIKQLATKGFKNTDIQELSYFAYKHNPTYFKKREKKLEEPITIKVPGGISYRESYEMRYTLYKVRINEEDHLIDFEKLQMMAIKKALGIKENESKFNFNQLVTERITEYNFMVEKIQFYLEEIETYSDSVLMEKSKVVKKVVDDEFNKAGINPDKSSEIIKYLGLYSGCLQMGMMYTDEIVLYGTTPKIVLDFKGFMHVAFRHCKVFNIGTNNVAKSRIPYELSDLKGLIKSCLHLLKDEINDHFKRYPDKRFSRFGDMLIRYNGDYFEIHINTKGIIETFYNHEKYRVGKGDSHP